MKYEISLSNIWMCILVIFIHTISYSIPSLNAKNNFDIILLAAWTLSLFAVPGFIFFSGMKSFLKRDLNCPKFLLKRIFTVFIPYLIWSYIYFIYYRYSDFFSYKDVPPHELFFGITLGNITSHLYFVVIIMQFYLLMPLWKLIIYKSSPYISLPFSFIFMITAKQFLIWLTANKYPEYFDYIDRMFPVYTAFWISGCYAGRYYDSFRRIISDNGIYVSILFVISSLLIIIANFQKYFMAQTLPFIDNLLILYQFSAIIFLYFISSKIPEDTLKKSFILNMIDTESYNIYLSQCLVITVLQQAISDGNYDKYIQLFIRFSLTYSIVLLFWSMYFGIKALIKNIINLFKKNHFKKRRGKH